MKLMHIADLHIGKRLYEYSLIEDQTYILEQIVGIARAERPDGILIAGDVYDKAQPIIEAVELLDAFLTELSGLNCPLFLISGNHDSPERLHFGSALMRRSGVYICGVHTGTLSMEPLSCGRERARIYMLPFIRPSWARQKEDDAASATDRAVREALSSAELDPARRNVLLCHQFVAGGAPRILSESETSAVGGLDSVGVDAFDAFDYVALGHLHSPQTAGRQAVRYSGSPLKYSLSEARHVKSVCVAEISGSDEVQVRTIPLTPKRDVRKIRGPLEGLCRAAAEDTSGALDYVYAEVTDERPLYDAIGTLRQAYPNLLGLSIDRSDSPSASIPVKETVSLSPQERFEAFFQKQNDADMNEAQRRIIDEVFRRAEEESET